MRIFVSTGEASGDFNAGALAQAIRRIVPDARFEGIGSERMRSAGFTLTANTRGWASMGPLAALAKIAPLYAIMWRHALRLRAQPPDVIVLVDFGVFNLRLAKTLRMIGYKGPIVYYFPPGAWLDRYTQAHAVARYTQPLTAFAHQRDYYRWLGLDIAFFGHPLASLIAPRPPLPTPPANGGSVALLPGSRKREIERHLPRLLAAFAVLKRTRPALTGTIGASDAGSEDLCRQLLAQAAGAQGIAIVRGSDAALAQADAAWIASGTAVLEAALREVPSVALYVVSEPEIEIGRRMWHGPYITLPNILLEREVIPELLQDAASPERLAETAAALLENPAQQLAGVREMRELLGPADALDRCAGFVVARATAEAP